MSPDTAERVLALLRNSGSIETVDITGGAPELNPNFRQLVEESHAQGRRVIDRCNLTILLERALRTWQSFWRGTKWILRRACRATRARTWIVSAGVAFSIRALKPCGY